MQPLPWTRPRNDKLREKEIEPGYSAISYIVVYYPNMYDSHLYFDHVRSIDFYNQLGVTSP